MDIQKFTPAPESHGYEPVDEWLSVRGSAPRTSVAREATAVKPWSFTFQNKFLMLALDHRGSFKKAINPNQPNSVPGNRIIDLKTKIISALHDQFSGLLIDPEYGLPAYNRVFSSLGGTQRHAASLWGLSETHPTLTLTGLRGNSFLLCVEKTGYQETDQGRVTQLEYKVSKLHALGASGIKLLVYFNPYAETVQTQLETARKVLHDAHVQSLPFFLEIVTYEQENKTVGRTRLVLESLKMFLENEIFADVFKLESPEDANACQQITQMLGQTPWILLSRGASFDVYKKQLQIAIQNGASGFLAGRALWQEVVGLQGDEQEELLPQVLKKRFAKISEIALK